MNMKKLGLLIAFALTLVTTVALAANRRVIISNQASQIVTRLYGSNVNADSWQEDVLGSDVLAPGESIRVNFDDGTGSCLFDIKAVFADGHNVVARAVNVCRETNLYIY